MLWAILNILQCLLIRSSRLGVLVMGRVIAGAVLAEGSTILPHHEHRTSFECQQAVVPSYLDNVSRISYPVQK